MKRFAALLLAFCLIVSALPASAFAADSIVGTEWTYVSHGLTFSPSANSTGVTYSFPAYLFTSDAASFPLRSFETVNAGLKYSSLGDLNTDKFYLIPPDSYISISVTLDVNIDDNVFVADLLSDLPDAKIYFSAFGATRMSAQRDGTKWLSPTVTGLHSFSYSYSYSLYTQDARQILSLLLMDCQLSGNLYLLGNMTFKISQAQFFVRSMGSVVSSVEKNTNTVINNINNTIIQNNTQVNQQLSSIISVLNEIYGDTSSINDLLSSLTEQINSMGEDLNSVLSYLQQINSALSYLPRIYSKLDSIGLSDDAIKALSKAISDGISLKSADLSTVENYLSNCLNQINHLADLVQLIADKLEVQCSSLSSILTELLNVGADLDLCVTYLTGINNTLGMLSATVEEMRSYVESSNQTLLDILSEMLTFDAAVKSTLKDILQNLVSQGADLSGMKSYLAAIKLNGAQANDLLRNLLDELQTVEAAHTETNERLAAIQDALDGFGVNLNQTIQQVMTDSDKQGLGGLISKIVNHRVNPKFCVNAKSWCK